MTDDPTTLLHELTGEALARGERLDELSVTRPSLEDVYLELTADQDLEVTARELRPDPGLAPVPARAPHVLAQPDARPSSTSSSR